MNARHALAVLALSTTGACANGPVLLSSSGQPGGDEAWLGMLFLVIGVVVVAVVSVLLLVAIFRRRDEAPDERTVSRGGNGLAWVLSGGVVVPVVVLVTLFVIVLGSVRTTAQPPPDNMAGAFEVVGHRWWWEIRRVDGSGQRIFVTANELHVPVGRPVRLHLSTADVIHSFWVPQLAGKTDLVPGQVNDAWLQADTAGVYVAHCAEYCGMQHAHMALRIVAESNAGYQQWLAAQEKNAAEPVTPAAIRGREVFLRSPCAACHRIAGTPAGGIVGPDLTHIGSRLTIGAGALPNNDGNIAAWIVNAQTIKPGNVMPPVSLEGTDLTALVEYLRSLK